MQICVHYNTLSNTVSLWPVHPLLGQWSSFFHLKQVVFVLLYHMVVLINPKNIKTVFFSDTFNPETHEVQNKLLEIQKLRSPLLGAP